MGGAESKITFIISIDLIDDSLQSSHISSILTNFSWNLQ